MCLCVGTYKEACAAVEKLEYDRYAFSTDRESSVERIVIEENQIDKFEKVQQKSISDDLNEARVELNNELNTDYSKKGESQYKSFLYSLLNSKYKYHFEGSIKK